MDGDRTSCPVCAAGVSWVVENPSHAHEWVQLVLSLGVGRRVVELAEDTSASEVLPTALCPIVEVTSFLPVARCVAFSS